MISLQNTNEKIGSSQSQEGKILGRNYLKNISESLPFVDLMQAPILPKILLVDDDPMFGKIMEQVAKNYNAQLKYYESVNELTSLEKFDFDVAVIDYDLGMVNGCELTTYIENYSKEQMPVIMVSQVNRKKTEIWPETIQSFVHKESGPYAILFAAFGAYNVKRSYKSINKDYLVTK